ncbi:AbiJ-related protein [Elizabethkingia miricola]|uniref:AbiJ-related protein n=1 Tax=Elizabethkingia miricola TaxID=172045 RepID=UPI003892C81E
MDFQLPSDVKKSLVSDIFGLEDPFNFNNDYTIVDFLNEFLDLRNLPSEDSRFLDAYDDAFQHIVFNDDWDENYIFEDRFKIIEDDAVFKKFLETCLNKSSSKKALIATIIEEQLSKFNYTITRVDVDSTKTIYKIISVYDENELNDIPFYVISDNNNDIEHYTGEYFILYYDEWDDYNFKTRFYLSYHKKNGVIEDIGRIKILKRDTLETYHHIPNEFYSLDDDYCTLFTHENFYLELKELFGDKFRNILRALNDAGYFPKIHENFENEKGFKKSLMRNEKEAEKILRTIRYKLNYGDVEELFNFNYIFTPKYSDISLNLDFSFDSKSVFKKRIYSIIGKNGVGKTLLIKSILDDFLNKNKRNITPIIPLYGKVLLSSFSLFDSFEKYNSNIDFNFILCGLFDIETKKPYDNLQLTERITNSISKIIDKHSENKYFLIIRDLIDQEMLNQFVNLPFDDDINDDLSYLSHGFLTVEYNLDIIPNIINLMSSGQVAIFFIITEIIANIRYNSLVIFDEPEIHLHPNAITGLMEVILNLLEEFDSYCIIATHSPLVVRELFSDNIYVLEKEKNIPRVRQLEFETFGENLTTITEDIFGNRDVSKHYFKTIKNLVSENKSYAEIEELLKGSIPLNLNLKILIKSLIENRNEES